MAATLMPRAWAALEPTDFRWRWNGLKAFIVRWTDDAGTEHVSDVAFAWDHHELDIGKPAEMPEDMWGCVREDLTRYFTGRECLSFDESGGK